MIRKLAFGIAAFALMLAPTLGAQQPTDPMQDMAARMQSMQQLMQEMHHMMMSMHGGGGGQGGGMMMGGMHGMGNADAGLGALFTHPVADLGLTDAQRTALQEILARAQAEAREHLTAEQRAKLDTAAPMQH